MKHILVGYGYTASYVAAQLNNEREPIEAYARKLKLSNPSYVNLICRDVVKHGFDQQHKPYYLYYFISPPHTGTHDHFLANFLHNTDLKLCQGIVYISSSAVYGNHHGNSVDENSDCYVATDRQKRRVDAEQQIVLFGQAHHIPALIIRCAGIYGLNRLPIDAARINQPVIKSSEAPLTNLIYVVDLAKIITYLAINHHSGIFNAADGDAKPMGYLQQFVAQQLGYPTAAELPYQQIYQNASEMKRFFMQSNKRIKVDKLLSVMPKTFQFTPIQQSVKQCLNIQGED